MVKNAKFLVDFQKRFWNSFAIPRDDWYISTVHGVYFDRGSRYVSFKLEVFFDHARTIFGMFLTCLTIFWYKTCSRRWATYMTYYGLSTRKRTDVITESLLRRLIIGTSVKVVHAFLVKFRIAASFCEQVLWHFKCLSPWLLKSLCGQKFVMGNARKFKLPPRLSCMFSWITPVKCSEDKIQAQMTTIILQAELHDTLPDFSFCWSIPIFIGVTTFLV